MSEASVVEQGRASAPPLAGGPQPERPAPEQPDFAQALGDFLVAESLIDALALDRALRASQKTGQRLDQVLTRLGLVAESDLTAALAKYLSLPTGSAADAPAEPVLPDLVTSDFVKRSRVMPLAATAQDLVVGVTDPFNDEPLRALSYLTGLPVSPRLFMPADFEKVFEALYLASEHAQRNGFEGTGDASDLDVQRLRELASEAPVIRLVNQVIATAVEEGASDIHIEPAVDAVQVRYRVDGVLRTSQVLAAGLRAALTSRVKIMAKLDIGERRMPQDGRIKTAVRGVDIDFRVSTIPTAHGESVVMRILDRSRVELDFAKLGFTAEQIRALEGLMAQPNGIVLVTGPTGSGKTTTLYTALKLLNSSERKIFTVEDPIEYQMAGINQVQVHSAIGLHFPHALRSILRQDPDIVMIGEIRDLETARIAIQASLTGHLVLSTLHTNDAASAVTRLADMGVEHYLLASTVKGIVAQRLVRRLCRHCSRPHANAAHWAASLVDTVGGLDTLGPPDIREPHGCAQCNSIGYSGRATIAEVLLVDGEVNRLILVCAPDTEIEAAARRGGMRTMYENGVAKVWRGETSLEEVLRATRAG